MKRRDFLKTVAVAAVAPSLPLPASAELPAACHVAAMSPSVLVLGMDCARPGSVMSVVLTRHHKCGSIEMLRHWTGDLSDIPGWVSSTQVDSVIIDDPD